MSKFVIKEPNSPASTSQTFMIFRLGGGDVRDKNLTKQQASDMIESLLQKKPTKVDYNSVVAMAVEAADKAGDLWMSSTTPKFHVVERVNPMDENSPIKKDWGPMLDVCSITFINVTDKRSSFAKWLFTVQGHNDSLNLRKCKYFGRQEMGLQEACYTAAIKVLKENGINCVELYSRID